MAGGNWTASNPPTLPGLYMNFVSSALATIQGGAQGVVAMPIKANWGPVGSFVTISNEQDLINNFTEDTTNSASAYPSVYFALLGGANKVLAYRLTDGTDTKASVTLQSASSTNLVTATAVYTGTRANNFNITIQTNALDATKKDAILYEGTTKLRTVTFDGTAAGLVSAWNGNNIHITMSKVADGSLNNVSNVALTGGTSGNSGVANTQYTAFLNVAETTNFNILSLDGVTDSATQTAVASWVQRVRGQGKGVQVVFGTTSANDTASTVAASSVTAAAGFNYEGVVYVGTGAILNGVSYTSAQIACYVAGLIAGQALSQSTTYAPTPFSDVTRRWTKTEQAQAITGGVFILIFDGSIVKPLMGVNTLTTLRTGQTNAFKKIRSIRVMDQINTDLQSTAEANYIGKVNNTDEGRQALLSAQKAYLKTMYQAGVINSDYDVYLDPQYYGQGATLTPAPNQVIESWYAGLTDVVEQIFGNFYVG